MRILTCYALLALSAAFPAAAQTPPLWRHVGGSSVELMLAAPATGPVDRVWYSPDGQLYAQTHSGKVFQTSDFENWQPASPPFEPPPEFGVLVPRSPESGIRTVALARDPSKVYGLGRQLYRSLDGGRAWDTLTAHGSQVVIGPGQRSIAVSPMNPDELVVANGYGVWRSLDGGLSWTGLNRSLPALPVRRILATPGSTGGARIQVDDAMGVLELPSGGSVWYRVPAQDPEAALRSWFAQNLKDEMRGATITAVAASADGNTAYAGSSDGRIWVRINGSALQIVRQSSGSTVERIFVNPARPNLALAALSGRGPHVLRTTNYGANNFWDPLDGNLPSDASAHAVTADWSSGAVYLATDKGVFWAKADLENNSVAAVNWTNLTAAQWPDTPATDVRLDAAAVQLYGALDGYGVFATAAPGRTVRIVSTADYTARAAAPGSLLSVLGGQVSSARGGSLNYPVLQVLGNDSQIQVPFEAVGPSVNLSLQTNVGSVTRELTVLPVSPAILVGLDGAPMLFNGDDGLPLDMRNGAHSNGRIQIWTTGLGKVRPDWPTGVHAPLENVPEVVAPVSVYLDGSPIQVTRATLLPGYIGFYLVEAQMPPVNNVGTSELFVRAGGQESNHVQLLVGR